MTNITRSEIARRVLAGYFAATERNRCGCCEHYGNPSTKRCIKHNIQVDVYGVCKDFDESPLTPLASPVLKPKYIPQPTKHKEQSSPLPSTGSAPVSDRRVIQIRAVDAPPVQLPDDQLSIAVKQWSTLAPDEEQKEHSREYEQRMATLRLNAMLSGLPPV